MDGCVQFNSWFFCWLAAGVRAAGMEPSAPALQFNCKRGFCPDGLSEQMYIPRLRDKNFHRNCSPVGESFSILSFYFLLDRRRRIRFLWNGISSRTSGFPRTLKQFRMENNEITTRQTTTAAYGKQKSSIFILFRIFVYHFLSNKFFFMDYYFCIFCVLIFFFWWPFLLTFLIIDFIFD